MVAAGTTLRFALLIALLVVASSSMMDSALWVFSDSSGNGCSLAAGVDSSRSSDLTATAAVLDQADAFEACVARYSSVSGWWSLAWPAALLVAAAVLFLGLPAWKARRGRVVPLAAVDQDGEILRALEGLAAAAGLARMPRVVVDPGTASTGAVVFGRSRRPTMCLHGGLLARRTTDPDGFRAVLLHELAHIRNGDVTITYITVALWRVFVGMVLLPYLAIEMTIFVNAMRSPFFVGELPMLARGLLLTVVLVGLVHLARADVLRSREVYADLAAVRWGAAPRAWAVTAAPDPVGGRLRRIGGRFVELWRTHPRWDLRRDALADPAALFGVRALPMFLTGVAASLLTFQASDILGARGLTDAWALQAMALVAAVLVTGSVGVVLWRAVTHAVLTARAVPSGVRAGLWLGVGLAASNLVMSDLSLLQWLPTRPAILLLVVLVGVVFAWWTAQCAQLWAGLGQGRTTRLVMALTLTAAGLVLSSWFAWWRLNGVLFAYEWPFDSAGLRQLLEQGQTPGDIAEHGAALSVIATVGSLLNTLPTRPLELLAFAALWVVPLLAWTVRPTVATPAPASGAPAGAVDDAQAAGEALPPLRRALLPGLLTGAVCWVAVAAVMAYLHGWQPPPGQRGLLHVWIYLAWVLVAFVAAALAAAVVASVSARRHRLIMALIAAQTATVVGAAGLMLLASLDGCLGPLDTIRATCHRGPADALWQEIPFVLTAGPVLAVIVAVVAAGVSAVRAAWRSTERRAADAPSRVPRRGGLAIRRIGVGVLCAATLGVVALEVAHPAPERSTGFDARASQRLSAAEPQVVSAEIKARQVSAWMQYGGTDLLKRFLAEAGGFAKYLAAPELDASGKPKLDSSVVRSHCLNLNGIVPDARAYFRIPDAEAQSLWRTFISQLEQSVQDCERAVDEDNGQLLLLAVQKLDAAQKALGAAVARIKTVLDAGRR